MAKCELCSRGGASIKITKHRTLRFCTQECAREYAILQIQGQVYTPQYMTKEQVKAMTESEQKQLVATRLLTFTEYRGLKYYYKIKYDRKNSNFFGIVKFAKQ